jgi:protein O-mannosyl-transferase
MKTITLPVFLNHLKGNINKDRKYCFILGAGASKQSGIRTGAELVGVWLDELKKMLGENEINQWLQEEKITKSNQSEHYTKIYEKRFELDSEEGYTYIANEMEGKEPSCGYSVLAQILDTQEHKIVITTNFDTLTEDALFLYARRKPLIVGHEALAGFIKPRGSRPVVVKIHRDVLFNPQSTSAGTSKLATDFTSKLTDIFKIYTPLIIGYGGNDGSLMDFLDSLTQTEGKLFWFCLEPNDLNPKIQKLIDKFDGRAIKIDGFDELMIQIADKLEFERLDEKIQKTSEQRIKNYLEQIKKIKEKGTITIETKEALDGIIERSKKDWWYYESLARKEKDISKIEKIYLDGISNLPDDPLLLGSYAIFLHTTKKDYEKAEEYYKKSTTLNSENAIILGDYANLLYNIRKDYNKAEEYYIKSISIDSNNAINLANYASFLQTVKKDYNKAEEYYEKSISLDSKNAITLGDYANFLYNFRKEYNKAEEYYKNSISVNPNDANNLGNYAAFLYNIRKDYDKAEEYYKKSISINPNNEIIVGAYAIFLFDIRKDYDKAEKYFSASISIGSNNAIILGSYASFLHTIKKDYNKAEEYYKKSISIEPENAINLGNYANLLYYIRKDYNKTEEYYKKSILIESENAVNLGNYASFLFDIKKDYVESEKYFEKSISLTPNNAAFLGNYSKLLIEKEYIKKAKEYIDKSFEANKKETNDTLELELNFYCYAIFPNEYPDAEKNIQDLINKGIRSPGWNLSKVVEVAEKRKHPNIKKLREFEKIIGEEK